MYIMFQSSGCDFSFHLTYQVQITHVEDQIPFRVGIASDLMGLHRGGKKLPMEDVCYYQWPIPGIEQVVLRYVQKLSEKVFFALDFMFILMSRDITTSAGYDYILCQVATGQVASNGMVALNYVHKLYENVSLVLDFMFNLMSRDITASVGYDYILRQCRLRGKIDSNGCIFGRVTECGSHHYSFYRGEDILHLQLRPMMGSHYLTIRRPFVGLTAGAIGSSVGSPTNLALIRMQADATLPLEQRRHYKNLFHALYRIVADKGVLFLWKGASPTVVREMALNMGMLTSYDQSVEFCKDTFGLGDARASAVSRFFTSASSLPFDYVKTQIQKMQPDATGKYPYTGSLNCALKTLKAGGPLKFYTGFPVYCVRIAPHVMMTWIFFNQIQKVEKKLGCLGSS
ncbi:hypothetical protein IFM89_022503 [Coptis chinensis]|uniref:Uncharacterized protein n=1 Tax=Coptis chinensis TaxID=261450 RepID=A0A835ICF1_9MAGN|nr:hypothetical protein IFM89_022503 [Coptis chinensis]